MLRDQYANFVLRRILKYCDLELKVRALDKIKSIPNWYEVAFGEHMILAVDRLSSSPELRLVAELDEVLDNELRYCE